jgi:hypothetical protein
MSRSKDNLFEAITHKGWNDMPQNTDDVAWNLFVEARKAILEYQKIRAQIVGFKITFVSTAVGVILANSDKVPLGLLAVPAFAAVFFDLLISSYSYTIKRTGSYCRENIEPVIKQLCNWPKEHLFWEEFMYEPTAKQGLAQKGNIGITVLTIALAIYSLRFKSPSANWISTIIIILLLLFLVYDIYVYLVPEEFIAKYKKPKERKGFLRRPNKTLDRRPRS